MTNSYRGTTLTFPAKPELIINRKPFDQSQPLFKYVDPKDAHFLKAGSIKVGTLRGYAALEGPRQDDAENSIWRAGGNFSAQNPLHRTYLESSGGFAFAGDGLQSIIRGINIASAGVDLNCLCFSRSDAAFGKFESGKALFKIDDSAAFLVRLSEICNLRSAHHVGHVIYKERRADIRVNPTEQPDPFVKPPWFIGEREVRVLWAAVPGREPATIYGKKDDQLAATLVRVR